MFRVKVLKHDGFMHRVVIWDGDVFLEYDGLTQYMGREMLWGMTRRMTPESDPIAIKGAYRKVVSADTIHQVAAEYSSTQIKSLSRTLKDFEETITR